MRKVLVVGAVVVVLFIVALVLIATNLERIVNKNKDAILARAESTLGREVGVGDIGVTLRRGIGVRLEEVTVEEDPSFGVEPFVEASELQVNVKLLPLLKKQVQVKRIVLRDPVIRIVKNEKGQLNTQSLMNRPTGQEASAGAQPGGAAVPLAVALATIENGEMLYVDETQGLALRVHRIDTSVKDFDLEKPLSMELEAALLSEEKNLKLRGTFGPLPKGETAEKSAPPEIPVDIEATIDALQTAAIFATLPRLAETLPKDVRVEGPLNAYLAAKGTPADMNVSVNIDGSRIDVQGPQGVRKTTEIPLIVDLKGRYTPKKLAIETASAEMGPLKIDADGEYVIDTPPRVVLNIRSKDIGLSGWETMVPIAAPYELKGKAELTARVEGSLTPGQLPSVVGTAKIIDGAATVPGATKPLSDIAAEVAFTQDRAEVKDASLMLGSSRIRARATIDGFKPVSLSYEVISPSLALADVRPPQPSVKKPERLDEVTAKGRLTMDAATKEPSGEGTVVSPAGSIANLDYQNLKASYSIAGKTIRISDMTVRALEGELKGGGVITTGEEGSSFDLKLNAQRLDVSELFTSLPGTVQRNLRGKANIDLTISGTGKEWPDIQKTLEGSGFAEIFEGEILDINFATAIFDEVDRYLGTTNLIPNQLKNKYPRVFEEKNTSFKNLNSDFVVDNGRLLARKLQLRHNDYTIVAKGAIGFDRVLEMTATFVVSKKLTDDLVRSYQAVSYLANAQGQLELPLVLTGALPKVQVKPDTDFIKNVVGKGAIEKGLDVLKKDYLKDLIPSKKKSPSPPDTTRNR